MCFSPCAFVKYSHKKSWNKILIALPRATVTSCVRCRYIRYKWQGTSGSKRLMFLLIWSLLRSFLLSVSCVDILWFVSLFVPCRSYFKIAQLACELWFYVSVQSLLNNKISRCSKGHSGLGCVWLVLLCPCWEMSVCGTSNLCDAALERSRFVEKHLK